ncbi:MAG: disulfide bond formation protein DsbA, partial [Bryobacterales bacterium]|nr:disulfide bond formation protein DsbA [Bryobacterales bacterium]
MLRTLALLLAAAILPAQPPSNWQAATTLPGLDMKGLTLAQQKVVLTILRDSTCPCGCPMQLAQCRVEDPACSQSLTLSTLVLEAAANKTAPEIRKLLADSALVKAGTQRDRILLDPVSINILGAPFKGPANAKITIVEFSDFQCPFCVKA